MYDVRCTHCGGIYNLGNVEVLARYTDCSIWKAPCCGRTVDDRGDTGWKSRKDYERLDRYGNDPGMDDDGWPDGSPRRFGAP